MAGYSRRMVCRCRLVFGLSTKHGAAFLWGPVQESCHVLMSGEAVENETREAKAWASSVLLCFVSSFPAPFAAMATPLHCWAPRAGSKKALRQQEVVRRKLTLSPCDVGALQDPSGLDHLDSGGLREL